MIERTGVERPDSVHDLGLVITEDLIHQRLGMKLAMIFPDFESDGAGIVSHGEELERLGKLCGYSNVIASLYFDEGTLMLGIFVREGSIPARVIDAAADDAPHPTPQLGE